MTTASESPTDVGAAGKTYHVPLQILLGPWAGKPTGDS